MGLLFFLLGDFNTKEFLSFGPSPSLFQGVDPPWFHPLAPPFLARGIPPGPPFLVPGAWRADPSSFYAPRGTDRQLLVFVIPVIPWGFERRLTLSAPKKRYDAQSLNTEQLADGGSSGVEPQGQMKKRRLRLKGQKFL